MNESFLVHITEIRKRLIYIFIGFLLLFLPLFHFDNLIYQLIAKPLLTNMPYGTKLIATDITSPFLVPMKLAGLVALILSMPNVIYQIWQFLSPGMYNKEKKLFLLMAPSSIFLFILGTIFCYFLVFPVIFNFIAKIKSTEISMMTDIGKYLDFVISLSLTFGVCFQMPILIVTLVYFKIVKLERLQNVRRYMLVVAFIIGAILAPPDIISQTMLSIPLYILYEIGMLGSKLIKCNE